MNGAHLLLEAGSSDASVNVKTDKKRYKCPYCEARIERAKLYLHIQDEHEDLIPEGYTALRVAFNTVNHKEVGHCIICKKETAWNENKGRYERLCDNPACHEAYKKLVAERNQRIYGTDRLQSDPRYADMVQRKALEGRKMYGKYKFQDGGEISYVGTYEKRFLIFMDQVMNCKSEDIIAPGPSIHYTYEGQDHIYIPDFYYEPYNLIVEIKDGGDNKNTHPKRLGEDAAKIVAKEKAVIAMNQFSYVRVVDNDFGQLMQAMAVLKYYMLYTPHRTILVTRVNEGMMLESGDKSTMDDNFESKERYKLSDYKKIVQDNSSEDIKSEFTVWKDGTHKVAQVFTDIDKASDGNIWFGSLKVAKAYRGHGLSEQILDYIIHKYHSNALTVYKDNEIAINLYKKKGFKIVKNPPQVPDEYYTMIRKQSVNEEAILESILVNQKDIYYNKDKFDSGEINLCFITGLSGSGKSTMANGMEKSGVEHYELDDLFCIKDRFTMENLKEYGDLIYSFFTGVGKKYYLGKDDIKNIPEKDYEDKLYPDFVDYAKKYAASHKNKKFVIEGVQLFGHGAGSKPLFSPSDFDDYAFYIKGTSMIVSKIRAAKRDAQDAEKHKNITAARNFITNNWKWYFIDEKDINRFRYYFSKKVDKMNEITEDMAGTIAAALPLAPNPIPHEADSSNYYVVQHPQNNVFAYGITKDPCQSIIYSVDPEHKGFYKAFKTDKNKIDKRYVTFKIKDSKSAKELYDELALMEKTGAKVFDESVTSSEYIYTRLTEGSKILTPDQLFFDSRFELVKNPENEIEDLCEGLYNWLKAKPIDVLEEQVNDLQQAAVDTNFYNVLPDEVYDLSTLMKWKEKFDSMPYENRVVSNDMSISRYGQNNIERFNLMKAKFMDHIDPEMNAQPDGSSDYVMSENSVSVSDSVKSKDTEVSVNDTKVKMDRAREAESRGLIIMVDTEECRPMGSPEDEIERLKEKWNRYQSLPEDRRVLSSQTASDIFGQNNENLYTAILNTHLKRMENDKEPNEFASSCISSPESNTVPTTYFTPGEKGEFTSSAVQRNVNESGESYTENSSETLMRLCDDLKHTRNGDTRTALKEQIYGLGWNPEIPYTREAASKIDFRFGSYGNVQEIDACTIEEAIQAIEDVPKERTSESLKDKIVPVFVILSHGVKWHSKGIMWFTDSEWSHASLSLDSSLKEMYTFTTAIDNAPNKRHRTGFAVDTVERYMRSDPHMKVKVYALFITPEQKEQMKDAIQWYIVHQDETKYGFKTILNIFIRRATRHRTKEKDKCKMVCSQFVYTILSVVNFRLRKSKDSSLVSPADIDELSDDARFYAVYQGGIDEYDSRKIDELCYKLLPTLPVEMYGIQEGENTKMIAVPKSAIGKISAADRVYRMAKEMLQ